MTAVWKLRILHSNTVSAAGLSPATGSFSEPTFYLQKKQILKHIVHSLCFQNLTSSEHQHGHQRRRRALEECAGVVLPPAGGCQVSFCNWPQDGWMGHSHLRITTSYLIPYAGTPCWQLSCFSLHTGVGSNGSHHWYPDKDFMKLYEGKTLMYRSPARRKNINIPETIL